ncbi:MAG: Mur ligase family protein, partial [Parcubacteria group bacterium]
MKRAIQKILAMLARRIVRKYKPRIVGITGSVGKTSAREACFSVLNSKFHCRRNVKNYNNELGVPLTIIGAESGGKNIFRWLSVVFQAWRLIIAKDKNYPEVLVLEMGADKPGDIEYLLSIAPLDAAVVTKVGPTHLEFFDSVENVAREKSQIIAGLPASAFVALNYDDPLIRKMENKTKSRVIFFGQDEKATVRSIDLEGQSFDAHGL